MVNYKVLSDKSFRKSYEFSLCTIANKLEEYEEMKRIRYSLLCHIEHQLYLLEVEEYHYEMD